MTDPALLGAKPVLVDIDPVTGRRIRVYTPVALRIDLLQSPLIDGDFVIIQGVCRREDDGSPTLLPLSDSAIVPIHQAYP